jgi:ABC-2 type transport system ATP-binding protein
LISFQNVTKRYAAVEALNGITMEIPRGEIFGYIGPNGAGKTTSLKILTGLITVFGGEVTVSGHSVKSARRKVQGMIGYVPQDAGFQEWRTVDHAFRTFAELSGVEPEMRERRIAALLERFSITEHRKRKIVHLSGGTVQKVRIAQALLHDPEVLILDEPLSGLDPSSRFDVKNILRELKADGRTILLSSHILSDVEDVADRIGILHGGELKDRGVMRDLQKKYQIGTILEIETNSSSGTREALAGISKAANLEIITEQIVRIHLENSEGYDTVSREILSALLSAHMAIRSFTPLEPSLEDVYLSLTTGGG